MTTETLKDPTAAAHPNPVDLEASIEVVRLNMAQLPWLQKSFGRAREMVSKSPDNRDIVREPKVYQYGGEYYPCLPNDALASYSFLRVRGERDMLDYAANAPTLQGSAPVDLIVWVNLQQLDPSKDYIFTDELIGDVLRTLNQMSEVQHVNRVIDERADDIFSGYTLELAHRDLLMYPYQAFRIEMLLGFEVSCGDRISEQRPLAQIDDYVRYCGNYDASTDLFPEAGGHGANGTIAKGDQFRIVMPGTLKEQDGTDTYVPTFSLIQALQLTPGQNGAKWKIFY